MILILQILEKLFLGCQLLASFLIIVSVHELGHLLFAKLFKVKVESYGIGMPPKILRKRYRGTEYYLGALPFGGAVRLSGVVEEDSKNSWLYALKSRHYFITKPPFIRLLIILGGIIFNFIAGILIFASINFVKGVDFIPNHYVNEHGGVIPNQLGREIGLKDFDKIIEINDRPFEDFNELFNLKNIKNKKLSLTVQRNNELYKIRINERFENRLSEGVIVQPATPPVILSCHINQNSEVYSLKKGDMIVSVNNISTPTISHFYSELLNQEQKKITLEFKRKNEIEIKKIEIMKDEIIFGIKFDDNNFLNTIYKKKRYDIKRSLVKAIYIVKKILAENINGIGKILSGKVSASKSLKGPVGILENFKGEFSFDKFWFITAMLSIALGLMNLLPIPAMDGGHALLIIFEAITRKKISSSATLLIQKIGILFLLALTIYVTTNDIISLF